MKAFSVAHRSTFAVAVIVIVGMVGWSAMAADSAASGRKHAAKANQLAAKNKCKSAVSEFTKAYKSLKDPTILFNRAECQRKLGNNADALKDYEQFLAGMPTAPNRAGVETRMATLREVMKAEMSAAPVVPAAPVAPAAQAPAAPIMPVAPAAAPTAPAASSGTNQPAPAETRQADKAPEAPVHRAEKWTD
jgi:tetratricopeptide (TPR) repeat protein